MKYITFCGGIKGGCASKSKKIINYICWLNIQKAFSGEYCTSVLHIGCLVPKG